MTNTNTTTKLSEERRVSLNSCFIPSISGVLIQQTLKRWYICHFLNNYDLNKGRFIVSRSPVRLPRGFCISNQRLFVLSGLTTFLHIGILTIITIITIGILSTIITILPQWYQLNSQPSSTPSSPSSSSHFHCHILTRWEYVMSLSY